MKDGKPSWTRIVNKGSVRLVVQAAMLKQISKSLSATLWTLSRVQVPYFNTLRNVRS